MRYYIVKAMPHEISENSAYGLFNGRSAMVVDRKYYYDNANLIAIYDDQIRSIRHIKRILDRIHIIAHEDEYFFEAKSDREAISRFREIMKKGFNAYEQKIFDRVVITRKKDINGKNFYGRCGIDTYDPNDYPASKYNTEVDYTVLDENPHEFMRKISLLNLKYTNREFIGKINEIVLA